jgi:TPR repeat protein
MNLAGSKNALASNNIAELIKYGDAYMNKDPKLGTKIKKEGCLPFFIKAAELGSCVAMLKVASYFAHKAKSINLNTKTNHKEAMRYFLMAANAGSVNAQLYFLGKANKGDKEKIALCEKVLTGKIQELSEKEIFQTMLNLEKIIKNEIIENEKEYGFLALALARLYMHQSAYYAKDMAVEQATKHYLTAIDHRVPGAKEELEKITGK